MNCHTDISWVKKDSQYDMCEILVDYGWLVLSCRFMFSHNRCVSWVPQAELKSQGLGSNEINKVQLFGRETC